MFFMKLSSISIIITALTICFTACSREEDPVSFSAKPAVYFIYSTYATTETNMDSISYTFLEKASTVEKDTIWLPVRISGDAMETERNYSIVAVNDKTNATVDVHYKLLNYTIPGGSFDARAGVVLLRDASLRTQEKVLTLRIQPTEDFPELMKETMMADGRYHSRNQIKIIFSDRLTKPANWETGLVNFFGAYSDVKFRFIAATLGRSTFPTSGTNALKFFELQYFQTAVRNALVTYNAANPTLVDEKGQPVVFP